MTIHYEDLLYAQGIDVLVLPVNAEGVMGAGMAKAFSQKYPIASQHYRNACKDSESTLSRYGYLLTALDESRDVLFFVTKKRWRDRSTKDQLSSVFRGIRLNAPHLLQGLVVGTPLLGCGCGKLNRAEVEPYIRKAFIHLGAHVRIYDIPGKAIHEST